MAKTRNYKSIGVKLPLAYSEEFGPYLMIVDPLKALKQDFKNLMLTNPGERVMNSDFGAGLARFLFENKTNETIDDINAAVYGQTAKYLPPVQVLNVDAVFVGNLLRIQVKYFIPELGLADTLDLNIEDNDIGTI